MAFSLSFFSLSYFSLAFRSLLIFSAFKAAICNPTENNRISLTTYFFVLPDQLLIPCSYRRFQLSYRVLHLLHLEHVFFRDYWRFQEFRRRGIDLDILFKKRRGSDSLQSGIFAWSFYPWLGRAAPRTRELSLRTLLGSSVHGPS